MNEYKITLSDPYTDVFYGREYITTDDSFEASEWIKDIIIDYSEYYQKPLIADVEVY